MINKKTLLYLIILVIVIVLVVTAIIYILYKSMSDNSRIISADVTINYIQYNDEFFLEPITFTVKNEDIELLLELEKNIIKHISPKGINLAPWVVEIVYHFESGEIVEKEYEKSGNDFLFKPLLDAIFQK